MAYKESRQLRILNFTLYDFLGGFLSCLLGMFLLIRSSLDPMFCGIFLCGPLQRMFIKKGLFAAVRHHPIEERETSWYLFSHLAF